MRLEPKSQRAKNRLNDHNVVVLKQDFFQGKWSFLTQCVDEDCPNLVKDGSSWNGWFTTDEVNADCDHDTRCCLIHDHHLEPHFKCIIPE